MSNYPKVKVIVAGDSGVGKTALTHLLCYNKVLTNPNWTIGAQVEIKLHDYQAGTPFQASYCVELWDIGGYKNHTNSRSMFYPNTDGIILVYDITNKKSESNLGEWVYEIFQRNPYTKHDGYQDESSMLGSFLEDSFSTYSTNSDWYRRSNAANHIPILVVGTHLDHNPDSKSLPTIEQRRGNIAQINQYEEIILSNMSSDSLAPGCSNSIVFDRFLDQVINNKAYSKTSIDTSRAPANMESYSNKRHVLIRMDKVD